jgi:hypothetical protein
MVQRVIKGVRGLWSLGAREFRSTSTMIRAGFLVLNI